MNGRIAAPVARASADRTARSSRTMAGTWIARARSALLHAIGRLTLAAGRGTTAAARPTPSSRPVRSRSSSIKPVRPPDTISVAAADDLKLRFPRALSEQQFERERQWLGSTGW